MYSVLLVDDEYMILEGLKKIIPWNDLGFEVVSTCRRTEDAICYLENHSVDLVITDVNMPEKSGIDLIRYMKETGMTPEILILSGYQEFMYVKQGLELGIKGYLLKPVDKNELTEKVMMIKEELNHDRQEKQKERLYNEMLLIRWLNDELNESEYHNFIQHFDVEKLDDYAVIICANDVYTDTIRQYSLAMGQKLCVIQENEDTFYTIIVYHGSKKGLSTFLLQMDQTIEEDYQLSVGELVQEWENVYESYEQALAMMTFSVFYDNKQILSNSSKNVLNLLDDETFEFMSFNKALMVGDMNETITKLKGIFSQMRQLAFLPDNVRHVTFLLFTDIYRRFPSLSVAIYNETLEKIKQSHNIKELEDWLIYLLELTESMDENMQRYSELVQKSMDIIDKEYKKDLTLKRLSEELHVNSVYLGQLVKKETGRSFAQVLNQLRIEKAQDMLLHTDLTINEISFEIGYNNMTYFLKMFRKLNGMTPKEFREKYKK